jgi:hypothetical protein
MAGIVVHHGTGAQLLDNIVEETQDRAVNLEHIHPELREAIGRFPRIPCHRRMVPMAPHGFEVLAPEASVTREFSRSYCAFLRKALVIEAGQEARVTHAHVIGEPKK